MIKYNACSNMIQSAEVIKETAKQVVYKTPSGFERREAKRSEYQNWFDTWEEAHAFLMSKAIEKRDYFKSSLIRAQDQLAKISDMEKPT